MDVKDIKFTVDDMVEILVVMSVDEYKEMYDGLLTQIYNEEELTEDELPHCSEEEIICYDEEVDDNGS